MIVMDEIKYPKEIEEIRKLGFEPFAHKFDRECENTIINFSIECRC